MTKGFTLIEILIYLVLVSLIATISIAAVYPLIDNYHRSQALLDIESETNFLMRKINWALMGAYAINQPASGSTSTILSINKEGFSQNPIAFDVSGGNLRISLASAEPIVLNNTNVKIEKAEFENIFQSGLPASVGVELSVKHSSSSSSASTTIKVKIGLRK